MQRGFGLIEIVVGSAIITLALFGILAVAQQSLRISDYSLKDMQAGFLAEEGAEALRNIRDLSWQNFYALPVSTTLYLSFTEGAASRFATTTANIYIDGFERSFIVTPVYRDGSDRIAASGTLDTGTRKVQISVAWPNRGATTTKTIDLYLTDI